jgi:small GTP-binding protein
MIYLERKSILQRINMSDYGQKFRFNIAVVGDEGVGKTSLMKKFTQGSFKKDYVKTIGAQFSVYDKVMGMDYVRLIFWNIAVQDTFHFLRPSFYHNKHAAIIVYSLEDNEKGKKSFQHIELWLDDIIKFSGKIPVIFFANKVDLIDESKLDEKKIKELVKNLNFISYYKTSSIKGGNVIEAFDTIIDFLYNTHKSLSKN